MTTLDDYESVDVEDDRAAADQEDDQDVETRVGHWMVDDADIYIGRAGPDGDRDITNTDLGERGGLGNPFRLTDHDRDESVSRFLRLALDRVDTDREFRRYLAEEVHGSTLGCWCRSLDEDRPVCHGDVLAKLADALADTGGSDR